MTDLQILSALHNNGGSMEFVALLNLNLTDPYRDTLADEERILELMKDHLVEGKAAAFCEITLTRRGRLFLQDEHYREERDHKNREADAARQAEEKLHSKFLRRTTIISIIAAAISAIAALAQIVLNLFISS